MEDKIFYLNGRAARVYYSHQDKLINQFHLNDDPAPATFEELVKRIKDGKYIFNKTNDGRSRSIWEGVQWRDPDHEKDQKGYEEACKVLEKERQAVNDIIHIKTPDEGLKAVQEFEAWEYKNKTKH